MTNKEIQHYQVRGVGTDIIEIHRIQEAYERHGERFLDRLFTEKEQAYCLRYKNAIPHFAGRFAAKEAVLKALGTGLHQSITWKEIEIINDSQGKPEVEIPLGVLRSMSASHLLLSISHCESYATATAILMG